MPLEITVCAEPGEAERNIIIQGLVAYNQAQAGETRVEPVALMLRDSETEAMLGGLWGRISYDWLFVELLFVPEAARGADLGTALLAKAEEVARARGCVGIRLDTYSFQAPDFYRKRGYAVFGVLDDHPVGAQRLFFCKRLRDG